MGWRTGTLGALGAARESDPVRKEGITMSILAKEKGMISIKAIFWLALLFVVIHVLIKIVPMWMDYSRMEDAMQGRLTMGQITNSDEEIKKALGKMAVELDLPLTQDSFIIKRDQNSNNITGIRTDGGWDVEVHFLWGLYIRTFHFDPVAK
jgi:hypothetical protein